jgi:hypothetical protein
MFRAFLRGGGPRGMLFGGFELLSSEEASDKPLICKKRVDSV